MYRPLIIACLLLILAVPASGFGIEPGSNNLGSEHEKITRAAIRGLDSLTLDRLAGRGDEPGAVGIPDSDDRGLERNASVHCEGGDRLDIEGDDAYPQSAEVAAAALGACRDFIFKSLDNAVGWSKDLINPTDEGTSLDCTFDGSGNGSPKCRVLEHLGLAFHAAQDFYARTNWVDKPAEGTVSARNPPGLGQSGRAPWLDPRRNDPMPAGLISSCVGDNVVAGIVFGCEYGTFSPLLRKYRVMPADLAKDTGPVGLGRGGIGTSPRGRINGNFSRAVAAAVEDTADKWEWFRSRIMAQYGAADGERIMCALERDTWDPALCNARAERATSCAVRERAAGNAQSLLAAAIGEPSAGEVEEATRLLPDLARFCLIEEADLTRSEVGRGRKADEGRALARERALRALSLWNACPASLERTIGSVSQKNREAGKAAGERKSAFTAADSDIYADIYADCILGVQLRRTRP